MAVVRAPRRLALDRDGIFLLLAATVIIAALTIPAFRDPANFANLFRQAGVLGILAIGQTFVIVAGMIDLSIGMIAGLVVVLSSVLLNGNAVLTLPVVALMILVGAGIGLLNGVLLNTLRLHPLILTFGMLSVLQGAIFSFTDKSVGTSEPLSILANGDIFGIPWIAILLMGLAVGAHFLFARSRFGYHLVAAGGNPESARRAGINVERIRLAVFVISGATAALAGVLLAGRLGTGYPLAGNGLELDAIVAVVLGGTLLSGGRGSIWRSLAGVLMLAVISNVLNLLGVSAFVQQFIKGVIVIVAILLNQPRGANA